MTIILNEGREDVVEIPAHTTLQYIAKRQAEEREIYTVAVLLLQSDCTAERAEGIEVLDRIEVELEMDRLNVQRQQRRIDTTW